MLKLKKRKKTYCVTLTHHWPLWALLVVNGGAGVFVVMLFWIATFLDKKWRLNTKVQHITIISFLTTVTVIFDSIISDYLLHSNLQLGMIVLFATGFLFGPVWGVVTGITSDLVTLIVGTNGVPSLLFTFEKSWCGFIGGLVLCGGWQQRKWLMLRFYFGFILFFATASFAISILYYATLGIIMSGHKLWIIFLPRLIKFFPQAICYATFSLLLVSFSFNHLLKNLVYPLWAHNRLGWSYQFSPIRLLTWLMR